MESDKENIYKTKIPIPIKPLPALPQYLLTDNKSSLKQDKITRRVPLRTINGNFSPQPGPSKVGIPAAFSINQHLNNVTLQSRNSELKRNCHVLKKEDKKELKVEKEIGKSSLISDDEDEENTQIDSSRPLSGTPSIRLNTGLEKSCLRNIKRSLKRPHSRELQGLSPVNEDHQIDEKFKRRLRFNEVEQNRLHSLEFCHKSCVKDFEDVYTKDIFQYLLAVEKKSLGPPKISNVTRACILNWLLKVNGINGDPAILQSASWYFDSILSMSVIPLNKLQLVASACYWIAQKLYGRVYSAAGLVKCASEAFTTKQLHRAEKVVLIKLDFPSQPVVIQEYITYLAWYCDHSQEGEIEEAAMFLSTCGLIVDKTLCNEYPSAIAAVATRTAIMMLHKTELICRLKKCAVYKAANAAENVTHPISSLLCAAVRTVAASSCEYKTLLQIYNTPPRYVAQKIINAINAL